MAKVSVIVPVYNGELYLRQCLDSICNQTLKDIEIICVDDGSTDSSIEILKEYQEKDSRFQIYQQANSYAGAARNLGMEHATGDYLVFWDCDDFFEKNALSVMYEKIQESAADICVCGANQYYEDKDILVPHNYLDTRYLPEVEPFHLETHEKHILNFTNPTAWNKMFLRSFVEKHHIKFQAIRNGNDIYFVVIALCLAEKIVTVNKALINYRKNQSHSITATAAKAPVSALQAWLDSASTLKALGKYPKQSFTNKVAGSFKYLLQYIKEKEPCIEAIRFIQETVLVQLEMKEQQEEYYYSEHHSAFVKHLVEDSPEAFYDYLSLETYNELVERSAEKKILGAKLKAKNKKIKSLSKQVELVTEEKEAAAETVASLETEVNKLKDELAKLSSDRNQLQNQCDKLQMELEGTQRELKRTNRKWKMTQDELSDSQKQGEIYRKKIERLENSLSYRLGEAILWLPRRIKRLFKK